MIMKNLKTFRQVLENADYSEFMNSRNIDKPKFMSIVDEVDEDDWFDDTDNFLDIFDDENDTITPEYFCRAYPLLPDSIQYPFHSA